MAMALVLVFGLSGAAAAQCCGDCSGDGEVSIGDLITAVNNSLAGCDGPTPTVTPTPAATGTATRPPTPTRTPNNRCPRDFADNSNQCTFNGPYNRGCGSDVDAFFTVAGTTVVVAVDTGVSNPRVVRFAAERVSANRANLYGWSTDNFQTVKPTSGQVELNDSGEQLVVFPNDPPFMIQGCNFVQYLGNYIVPRAAARADAEPPDLDALRAWRARPVPELAQP